MRQQLLLALRGAITLCSVAVLMASGASAQVIDDELRSVLDGLRPGEKVAVVVRFDHAVALDQFNQEDLAARREAVVSALKARSRQSVGAVASTIRDPSVSRVVALWGVNGLALFAGPQVIEALARNPMVATIRLDAVVELEASGTGSSGAPGWNLAAVDVAPAWAVGADGTGVVVGSMDTGVDAYHPDLAPRYRGGANSWFDPWGQHASPSDIVGHGTQTMGLIVGGSASGNPIGVAPGARWIAAKIFNDSGQSSLSAIHAAFQWMLDPDGNPTSDDSADVVNCSWTLTNVGSCSLEFEQDLQVLRAAEVAVVFAGGNYGPGPGTSVSPANNPSGFAVGSVDQSGLVAGSSSSGPATCDGTVYPELVAPGVSVRTTDLSYGGTFPDSYVYVSGTSFAAPHVAGAMAVLLSRYSPIKVELLERALTETAVDLGPVGADNSYGFGLVDVQAALQWLADPPPPPCNDRDGDGFFAEAGCGGAKDCNDLDAGVNPAACDIKNDGIDQDCDGADRTRGKPCPSSGRFARTSEGGSTATGGDS